MCMSQFWLYVRRRRSETKNVPCKIVSDQQKENTVDLLLGVHWAPNALQGAGFSSWHPKDPACSTQKNYICPAGVTPSVTLSPELWFHLPPTQPVWLCWLGGLQTHELCCCKMMFPRDNEHISGNQLLGACLLPLVPQLTLGSFGELSHFTAKESSGLRWSCKHRRFT